MQREESFYRRLLELDTFSEPAPIVAESLQLVTELCGAQVGYIELFAHEPGVEATFRHMHGPPARRVAPEIIRAALEDRTTLNIASAHNHPRFRLEPIVTIATIRAVMCTPIGVGVPIGAVYLEGRDQPGRFPDVDRERIELFARHLATAADRICTPARQRVTLDDEVRWLEHRMVRASLDRNGGNVTTAARALGITRTRLYRILRRGAA